VLTNVDLPLRVSAGWCVMGLVAKHLIEPNTGECDMGGQYGTSGAVVSGTGGRCSPARRAGMATEREAGGVVRGERARAGTAQNPEGGAPAVWGEVSRWSSLPGPRSVGPGAGGSPKWAVSDARRDEHWSEDPGGEAEEPGGGEEGRAGERREAQGAASPVGGRFHARGLARRRGGGRGERVGKGAGFLCGN